MATLTSIVFTVLRFVKMIILILTNRSSQDFLIDKKICNEDVVL